MSIGEHDKSYVRRTCPPPAPCASTSQRVFTVEVSREHDGTFVTSVPEFDGLSDFGSTLEEALENTRQAILAVLEVEAEDNGTVAPSFELRHEAA